MFSLAACGGGSDTTADNFADGSEVLQSIAAAYGQVPGDVLASKQLTLDGNVIDVEATFNTNPSLGNSTLIGVKEDCSELENTLLSAFNAEKVKLGANPLSHVYCIFSDDKNPRPLDFTSETTLDNLVLSSQDPISLKAYGDSGSLIGSGDRVFVGGTEVVNPTSSDLGVGYFTQAANVQIPSSLSVLDSNGASVASLPITNSGSSLNVESSANFFNLPAGQYTLQFDKAVSGTNYSVSVGSLDKVQWLSNLSLQLRGDILTLEL